MQRFQPGALVLPIFTLAACGGSAGHSEPITIKVASIKNGDVEKSSGFTEDKNVNTEEGNPYAVFLRNAQTALAGRAPSAIEVIEAKLNVSSDSKGIGTGGFSEILAKIELFLSDGTTTVALGSVDPVPEGSELEVPISAVAGDLQPIQASLLSGAFKVGVRGNTAADLPAEFELKMNVRLVFDARE